MWRLGAFLSLLLGVVPLTPVEAQQVIRHETVVPLAAPLPPDRNIRLYARQEGEAIFLLSPRSVALRGGVFPQGEAFAVDKTGNSRRADWGAIVPVAAAAHGSHVFLIQPEKGRLAGVLLDRNTGSRVPVAINGAPISAALCERWLAILSSASRHQATLSLFDLRGTFVQSADIRSNGWMAFLSFANPELLLILQADFRVTSVSVGPPLAIGPTVELNGPEVEASRSRISQLGGNAAQSQFFSGHIPGRQGNNLFFLSPYRHKDGARLVEFNPQGAQVASYRFVAEESGKAAPLMVDFGRVAVDDERVWLVAANGSQFSFRRP